MKVMAVRKRFRRNRKPASRDEQSARLQEKSWWLYIKWICVTVLLMVPPVVFHLQFNSKNSRPKLELTDPDYEHPPSHSALRKFKKGAVSSDAVICSEIGRDLLKKNGSAVDAAIGILLCNGIVNMELLFDSFPNASKAMGIGGGVIMTVFIQNQRKAYSLIARESAPSSAHRFMFNVSDEVDFLDEPSRTGGLAVGVPGELKGYWEAWRKFGRLPWKDIVSPSVGLCYKGYELSKPQHDALKFRPKVPISDPNLREWFFDDKTNALKKWGSNIIPRALCQTYERIATEGGLVLHDGSLTEEFVEDIQAHGGKISVEDMKNYSVDWAEPLTICAGNDTLITAPLPASGVLLFHILQILKGYNMTKGSFSRVPQTVMSIHRIVEAFKFAFAKRSSLGDPNFIELSKTLESLLSESAGEKIRVMINDQRAYSDLRHYGGVEVKSADYGTNHVSVISENGDAVSATSSINLYFGAGFTAKRSGIILNSVMDDFSIPNTTNYFDFLPTSANSIEPGKKPLSSACPTIVLDSSGRVKVVIGAAGGSRIITAITWVLIRTLWLGEDLKKAIDASRFHHQLYPMFLSYEYGMLKDVVQGLKNLGHDMERYTVRGSVVSAVAKLDGDVYGNADFRKFGGIAGVD